MNQIDDLLTVIVDQQRAFYNEEARRLNEFYPLTQNNAVTDKIYQAWFLAYSTGIEVYKLFDATAQAIKSGDLKTAKKNLNLHENVELTGTMNGDKRTLALILVNDFLPSQYLQKICKEQNRYLIKMILELSAAQPQAGQELDLLSTWITTFPHSQPKEEAKEKLTPFFAGWIETGLKVLAGYLIGKYQRKRYTLEDAPPPPPNEAYF